MRVDRKSYKFERRYKREAFHGWAAKQEAIKQKRLDKQKKEKDKYEKFLEKRKGKTMSLPEFRWMYKMKGFGEKRGALS